MVYVYSFSVWPDEAWEFSPAFYDLFRMMLPCRIEDQFTEAAFDRFRSDVSRHGITLREIERWPYVAPEAVQ